MQQTKIDWAPLIAAFVLGAILAYFIAQACKALRDSQAALGQVAAVSKRVDDLEKRQLVQDTHKNLAHRAAKALLGWIPGIKSLF